MMKRTYTELRSISSFQDRLNYLMLNGIVGEDTFGFDRYLNQRFYQSEEWRQIRNHIIVRDEGCDLGIESRPIFGKILIHHMEPLLPDDLIHSSSALLDPENLICVSLDTHNLIHYGYSTSGPPAIADRKPGDTKLW